MLVILNFIFQEKPISTSLLFFPFIFLFSIGLLADPLRNNTMINSQKTTVSKSKPELSAVETEQILDYLNWQNYIINNKTDSNILKLLEYISKKSKEYYIPVSITHRLMEISRLHNEGHQIGKELQTDWEIRKVLIAFGIPLHQLKEQEISNLIEYVKSQNWNPTENQRAFAIIALGEIGQMQMLPPNVVRYLRTLIFEATNPNIRLAVIQAFGKISILHPPDQGMLKQIAKQIRQSHEENNKPPRVFIRSLEYELIYKALKIIAQNRVFPIELVQTLSMPLNNSADNLKRIDFLQNFLLPLTKKNRWPRDTISYLERKISPKHSASKPNQGKAQKEDPPNAQCPFSFHQPERTYY